jgi:hypothetical protein
MFRAPSENSSQAGSDNKINSVHKLYPLDLSTFGIALLFCYPQQGLAPLDSDSVTVLGCDDLAPPDINPDCLPGPLPNPTKCKKLGLESPSHGARTIKSS